MVRAENRVVTALAAVIGCVHDDDEFVPSAALHIPGAHLAVATRSPLSIGVGLRMRQQGWHVRDSIAWLRGDDPNPGWVVLIGRAPLAGTVADTVTRHGTGAMNLDAVRVGFANDADETETKTKNRHAQFGSEAGGNAVYGDYSMVARTDHNPVGRWPTNLLLTHHPDCRQGDPITETVPINRLDTWSGFGQQQRPDFTTVSSIVTTPTWVCHPTCPVDTINTQSGTRPSTGVNPSEAVGESWGGLFANRRQGPLYADTGGAARFYPQLAPGWPTLQTWLVRLLVAPGGTWQDLITGTTRTAPSPVTPPEPATPTADRPDNTVEWSADTATSVTTPVLRQGGLW